MIKQLIAMQQTKRRLYPSMDDQYQDDQHQTPSRRQRHQHKDKKPNRNNTPAVRIRPVLAALLLLMLMFLGAVAGSTLINSWQDKNKPVDISTLPQDQQQAAKDERALQNINILLVGCDQRDDETARADTIMLATLRPIDKEVSILSIPRDTRTKIPGYSTTKINHALAYGGMDLLKETVENLLDVHIDYTMQVNFDAFQGIIDALGGVTLDVETRMYKPLENIDLQPGLQHLNGYDALAYVRWRSDGRADLGRIERQQKFLAALVDGLKNMNLKEALSVAGAVMDNLTTDMSVADMTRYGSQFIGMGADGIETHSLQGKSVLYNDISYLEVTQQEIDSIMELMKYGNPEETDPPTEEDPNPEEQ